MEYKLLIAEPSDIIRKGLIQILETKAVYSKIKELPCVQNLNQAIVSFKPDIIMMNPSIADKHTVNSIREELGGNIKLIAIVYSLYEPEIIDQYDEAILIGDNSQKILRKIDLAINHGKSTKIKSNQHQLTQRELDVLKLLVKGLNTKDISEVLFISTHTVISHRKNISHKLGIKSLAGLTVYAIINELIGMEDVS